MAYWLLAAQKSGARRARLLGRLTPLTSQRMGHTEHGAPTADQTGPKMAAKKDNKKKEVKSNPNYVGRYMLLLSLCKAYFYLFGLPLP